MKIISLNLILAICLSDYFYNPVSSAFFKKYTKWLDNQSYEVMGEFKKNFGLLEYYSNDLISCLIQCDLKPNCVVANFITINEKDICNLYSKNPSQSNVLLINGYSNNIQLMYRKDGMFI